jgi:UTP--glucose-1-phosphate uridylyltransferase
MTKRIRKAVFPVGGLGTRFLPATKAMPKEMLPVVDKPLIQYAVEEAAAAGIEDFIFVTGRAKQAIEDHFDVSFELEYMLKQRGADDRLADVRAVRPTNGRVSYTRQGEALGLGHAVLCARDLVGDEPFAVLLADDLYLSDKPCLQQMVEVHDRTGGNVVAVIDVPPEQTNRYGILDIESEDGDLVAVRGMVEKPAPENAPSNLSIVGRYILQPEIFDYLAESKAGAGGEIQLTDAMARLIGGKPFHGLRAEGRRFDCGDKMGFFEANLAFALQRDDLAEDVRRILNDFADS